MKILISHASVYKGRLGKDLPLACGLSKLGNKVTILTTNPRISIITKREIKAGVNIIIYPEIIPSRVTKMGFDCSAFFLRSYMFYSTNIMLFILIMVTDLSGIPCR